MWRRQRFQGKCKIRFWYNDFCERLITLCFIIPNVTADKIVFWFNYLCIRIAQQILAGKEECGFQSAPVTYCTLKKFESFIGLAVSGATDISHFSRKMQHCDWYRIINRAMRDSGILPTAESFSRIIYCLIIPVAGSINSHQANTVCFFLACKC